MKIIQIALGFIVVLFFPDNQFPKYEELAAVHLFSSPHDTLKGDPCRLLEPKRNSCHEKQNPFMVFIEKKLEKHAPMIYKAVFMERRMPKGDEIKLSDQKYDTLQEWLLTQQIN